MTFRGGPRTIDEKVADLEEQVRRLQTRSATTPVVTDYGALQGTPTDLATLADLAPISESAANAELLAWLNSST